MLNGDEIALILRHLDIKDLLRYKRVCKKFNTIISSVKFAQTLEDVNHLTMILEMIPHYDKLTIHTNKNITPRYLMKKGIHDSHYPLPDSPHITWDIIKDDFEYYWDFEHISNHPDITWDIVKNHPNLPWDYNILSKKVTFDIAEANPSFDWSIYNLLKYTSIKEFEQRRALFLSKKYYIGKNTINRLMFGMALSKNKNIDWLYVKNNPEIPWYYEYVAYHSDIDIIMENPKITQCLQYVSIFEYCVFYPKFPHEGYINISSNKTITPAILEKYEYHWEWTYFVKNRHMVDYIIKKFPIGKHMRKFAKNKGLIWQHVRDNLKNFIPYINVLAKNTFPAVFHL